MRWSNLLVIVLALAALWGSAGCYGRLRGGALAGQGGGGGGGGSSSRQRDVSMVSLAFGGVAEGPRGRFGGGMTAGFAGDGEDTGDVTTAGVELLADLALVELGRVSRLSGLVRGQLAYAQRWPKDGAAEAGGDDPTTRAGVLAELGAGLGYDLIGPPESSEDTMHYLLLGVLGTAGYLDLPDQPGQWGYGAMLELSVGFDLAKMLDGIGRDDR